jgi:EAL domain-containing protein (putative c-di-GMP-specific phosphodiesterase class I)
LNDFPFSKVKIDRKFSQKVDESPRTSAIVNGTAQIARDLRMECIAEGVETEVQLEQLRRFGINAIQGFLFSRPLPARQLRKLIKEPIFPIATDLAAPLGGQRVQTRRKVAS